MTVDPMFYARFAGPPEALAANADRDRAIDVLKAGYAEGRLTKAEHDDRVGRVYAARTYGELGSLIADLPAGPLGGQVGYPGVPYPVPTAQPRVNGLAVAALAFGIAEFFTMGAAAIPALVLGHAARQSIRRTGERGDGMALAGIILGWAGLALVVLAALLMITVVSSASRHAVVVNPAGPFPDNAFPANPGGPLNGG
jgi:hypothetical protein